MAVLGFSTDKPADNLAFKKAHALPFPLLCDTGNQVCLAYGACDFESAYYANRLTFVIDENGTIVKVFPRVEVATHVAEILDFLDH